MTRSVVAACVALLAISCGQEAKVAISPSPAVTSSPTATPRPTPDPSAFDISRAMAHDRVLGVDIGVREAGTEGDRRAERYISDEIAKLGWRVELQAFPLPQGGQSTNVLGLPSNFDENARYLIIGGHRDSLVGPGANDNGTGVAASLEIARSLATRPPALPVVFVAFGAEERQRTAPGRPHHVGSRYYVAHMSAAARRNLVAFVDLDEIGGGQDGTGELFCDRMTIGPREATNRCLRKAVELGYTVGQRITGDISDHGTFLKAGLNATWLWSGDFCCFHTPKDTFDGVRPAEVERAGRLALALLRSYS